MYIHYKENDFFYSNEVRLLPSGVAVLPVVVVETPF